MSETKNLLSVGGGSINPTPPQKPKKQNLIGEDQNDIMNMCETAPEKTEELKETFAV